MKTLVIALGGNALLQRKEALTAENQYKNIAILAEMIIKLAKNYRIVLVHGNGPQVGLLSLQNEAYKEVPSYPLDILVAESQAMIGYMITQKINELDPAQRITTILTRMEVDLNDPDFKNPSKFIGPVYDEAQKNALQKEQPHWQFKKDGEFYRRVVPSPRPQKLIERQSVNVLLDAQHIVICGGGGGIPVNKDNNTIKGIEAVIDKDLTASLIAQQLGAENFVILTDADAVYTGWGTPEQKAIEKATTEELAPMGVSDGSMGPKVMAVCDFVNNTGHNAYIGALKNINDIMEGKSGTLIYKK